MEFSESICACYVIDSNQSIVAFRNHDKRLLFDNEIVIGSLFMDVVDVRKNDGFQVVIDAVCRAIKYNRGVCQEYISLYGDGQHVCVGLLGEWNNDGNLNIYLNPMDKLDELINVERKLDISNLPNLEEMGEWLDIGVQIFDADGVLIAVNDYTLIALGVDNKEDILGVNIYEHPCLSDALKKALLSGEDTRFDMELDNKKLDGYYKTKHTDIRNFKVALTTIYDGDGNVHRHLLVIYNNSDSFNTEKYKNLKELYEHILDRVPMAVLIKKVEDSRYVFCNDESRRMLDVSLGMRVGDIITSEFVELIDKIDMEVCSSKKPYLGYERMLLNNGKQYDTIVRKSLIDYNNEPHILIMLWDESLQNSLKQYYKLLQILKSKTDADIWMVEFNDDDIVRDSDGSIINILNIESNSEFKRIHPDHMQKALDSILNAFSEGSNTWRVEFRSDINLDGVYKWCESTGVIDYIERNDKSYVQIFGVSVSIESQKEHERVLLDNQEKLNKLIFQNNLIINNTDTGLVYIDADYNILWNNLSTCLARVPCGIFKIGEKCYYSAHKLDNPCAHCILHKAQITREVETKRMIFDDGVVVEIHITPVFDANEQIEGAVMRLDDVTNREDMIKELQAAKFNAEESERLKTAFLANMSHEIRTPLNAIIGFSELMADASTQESKEYFQIISANSELLLALINNILDLSKIEAGVVKIRYERMNINDCFNEVVASLADSIDSTRVRLVLDNTCDEYFVNMDVGCITQILINYLTNAIKYTANGLITIGCRYENNGIYLYVKDTGIGIAEDRKALIFDRFEKINEFAQGTGLGLSICKGIVNAMNGQLGVESTKNVGSLFWAFLPFEEHDVN